MTSSRKKQRAGSFAKDFLAAGTAAAISKTVVAPMDRVKLLLQNQSAASSIEVKYTGIPNAFVRVCHEQGVVSLWRGNLSSVIRYFPSQALTFAINDQLRPAAGDGSVLGNLFSGGIAGLSTLSLVYPLDLVRTRLAMDVGVRGTREFAGLRHCLRVIWRSDGLFGWYRGFVPSALYIFLYRSWYFGVYETVRTILPSCSFLATFAIGQITALSGMLALYPLDTVRRRMMMLAGASVHSIQSQSVIGRKPQSQVTSGDITRDLLKTEGIRGFYRGVWLTLPKCFAGGLVLALYDVLRKTEWS